MKLFYKIARFILIFSIIVAWTFNFPPTPFLKNFGGQGWPQIWQNPPIPPKIKQVRAATNTDTYSTAGDYTWTAPPGVTSATVEAWGAGGGGGIVNKSGGGGGGGGAYASSVVSVTPGTGYAIGVGDSGAMGVAAGGGDSTFATTVVVADGGSGATTATGATGGTTANSTGTTEYAGGTGGTGSTVGDIGGGGGGAAGPDGDGNNGSNGSGGVGGNGGSGDAGSGGAYGAGGNGTAGGDGSNNAKGGGGGGGGDDGLTGGRGGSPGGGGGGGEVGSAGVGADGQVKITYTIYTVLGNGASEPSNTTIGPGDSATDLDNFTFQDSYSTDTVTALTVTLGPDNAYNNIAQVDITDTANVAKCTAVAGLSSNTVTFSSCSISVTTTETTYKIRITPKGHANMPAVPGASYATTGTVTSYTCTNSQTGTDSGSATITVDNASPSDGTWGTITPGDQQVGLGWTNPDDADFSKVLILRKAGSEVTDTPTEGQEYSVPGSIGDSTIIYVNNGTSFTDTGLTNGTNYYYKIFAYDTRINYAVSSSTGPHTPFLVSISLTTEPGLVAFGFLGLGATASSFPSGVETVSVDSGPADLDVRSTNFTQDGNTWTLSTTNGNNQVKWEFSKDGSSWTTLAVADNLYPLDTNVPQGQTRDLYLQITMPTDTSSYNQFSSTVTIVASGP